MKTECRACMARKHWLLLPDSLARRHNGAALGTLFFKVEELEKLQKLKSRKS
jgi:hypothetical protein